MPTELVKMIPFLPPRTFLDEIFATLTRGGELAELASSIPAGATSSRRSYLLGAAEITYLVLQKGGGCEAHRAPPGG